MKTLAYSDSDTVQVFLDWIKDTQGGLAAWVEHYLNAGDEQKLREIYEVYTKLKNVFGF